MKNRIKKWMLALCLWIGLGVMSLTVSAATEYVDGYLRYTVEGGSVKITGYNGRESEVTIPDNIAGNPVNIIGAGAFSNAASVIKVNLPDTIMTIEEGAFGEGQTVVYNSNKGDAGMTQEPDQMGSVEEVDVAFGDKTENVIASSKTETSERVENIKKPEQQNSHGKVEKPTDESMDESAGEESYQETTSQIREETKKSGGSVLPALAAGLVLAAAGIFIYKRMIRHQNCR